MIRWADAGSTGTFTSVLPVDVEALTAYVVGPAGRTTSTEPVDVSARTSSGRR